MSSHVPWEAMQGTASSVVDLRHSPPHRTRAMTTPTQPHVLFPARRPNTIHTSDIYFVSPSKNNRPTMSSSTTPRHSPLTPTSSPAYPHPFRSFISPPPIPPKPAELQQESLKGQSSAEIPGTQMGQTEEAEFAAALELSKSESTRLQTVLENLDNQEEEDLAQAMAESLKTTTSRAPTLAHQPDIISPVTTREPTIPIQSPPTSDAAKPTSSSASLAPRYKCKGRLESRVMTKSMPVLTSAAVAPSDPVDDPCANDEAIARRLAEEESLASRSPGNSDARLTGGDATSPSFSRSQSVPFTASLIPIDENHARASAEQDVATSSTARARSKSALAYFGFRSSKIPELPPPYEVPPSGPITNSSESDFSPPSLSVAGNGSISSQSRSGSEISSTRFLRLPGSPEQSADEFAQSPIIARSPSSTSLSSPAAEWGVEDPLSPSAAVNPYVADELLKGVSIGFDPPLMSPQISTWQHPLPTIISLPYGRSVPLHLQATSWRHLLKLLARLPGTTIQPTIEAMAVTKTEHRLRTVVQFVKPHLASTEWRTILWFTLEHPVPDDVTGRSRYVNDVNVLPWSYTFSAVPQLLRGGFDSQLSRPYTIPTSSSFPFPTLPITFPDLAMYLHEALEISRRHINDSSSGVRKLAKMIEICYPNMNADETDDPERRRVSGLFKNLIGRGNRRRGGNEDTYDLVTPFVANEWG